ncbi:hypothetical protein [Bradyrhizobium sp. AZCC 1693]|uniref:hypothetical protein n=1 Tax=Bradyrhizobium sp. AZCC 1693 TaxID=3117029 RepID=UPI002FF3EC10
MSRLFPDGFSPLFRPAAALPALLVMPVSALPVVALPVVVPLVEGPVVVLLVAAPPVAELPPAEPPVDCASAQVPVNASAVANPNVASFMIAPFLGLRRGKRGPRSPRSCLPITVRCCSHEDFNWPQMWNRSGASVESPADISNSITTEDCLIELAALSRPPRTVHPVRLECAMPVALVVLLLDITLIYHASRTERLQPWAFIILMIPLVGALAYIVVELVPEWFGSAGAQQARKRIAGKLDSEKLYRELSDRLANTDTVANRAALAAECLRLARFDEAVRHYDHILMLPLGGEPAYALGRAQAEFGRNRPAEALATLDDLQNAGRALNRPRRICSMRVRWQRSGGSTRRSKNTTRWCRTPPARRHGSATACCCAWSAATPRPE